MQQEEGEQAAARHFSDHADAPDSLRIIENDARMKTALLDEARQQRTKRFVSVADPLIIGPVLARAIAAVVDSVRNKEEAAAPAKTDRFVFLTIDKESPAWGTLSAIQTATQALLAAAVTQHGELGFAVAEGFVERLLDASGERARSLPLEISRVVDNETKRQRLSELAALLYCAARVKISPSTREITVEGGIALNQFNPVLEGEALRRRMFERPSLPEHELQDKVYFDGNALVNAVGKSVSQLAEEPSLLNIPAYARLSASDRLEAVEKFLDERGLDYQYPIGRMENAMASVLKASALARGNPAPEPYATEADVYRAFMALVNDWQQVDGTLIDPRVLLGINLAKTRGIALAGNTPEERFADLCSYLNDVLIEYSGPPHFDERAVTLEILMEETGLSAAQLIQPLKTTGKSMLDTFLDRSKQTPINDAALIADNGAEIHVPSVARKLKKAESTFRTEGRFDAPYFSAAARLRLRTIDKVPQTDAAIEAILAELVKSAQKEESDARTAEAVREIAKKHPPRVIDPFVGPIVNSVNWILARVKEHDSERGTNIRHWLDNMPILSNVIGFAEGVETANLEQIINSLPVVGAAYNMGDGLRTGDHERFGMAVVSMVPLVGPGITIAEGIAKDDTAQVVGGILGLALDAAPFAEGKGKAGGVRKVVSYSALDDARVTSRTIPLEGISRPLQVQVNQSLTALRDLGFAPDAKALKIARVKVPGKAAPKPVPSISTIRSLDVVRVAKKLEGYEVATRPAMLQRTASGMLWDPATAAHYAELEGNLYRLAPDRAKTTPQRPIWNVVSPDGSNRVRAVHLEYIFDNDVEVGQWRNAKNLPGLKGGNPDGEIGAHGVDTNVYDERGFFKVELARERVEKIDTYNRDKRLGFDSDVSRLSLMLDPLERLKEEGRREKGALVEKKELLKKEPTDGEKSRLIEDISKHRSRFNDMAARYGDLSSQFSFALEEVAKKINDKLSHVARIESTVKALVDEVPTGRSSDGGTVMRLMSKAEADDIKSSGELRQGGSSFEQHKWFYTDRNNPPIQGKSSPYRLEIDVPKSIVDEIHDMGSNDPTGTTDAFRVKLGPTNEYPDAPTAEEKAFGVQTYGLREFSRLLDKRPWKIVDNQTGRVYFSK
ncbi:hypothetical protein C9I57_23450 [Trinickia symbiotica]|uniref:Uncharacterized protein n=1 Tax=Trinickia symbiotica TaxID=863227 RepID=A0A2T3XNR3_9BURK|nr:hypothetical protein C9I57_23450 [Trinickia symbiotica]